MKRSRFNEEQIIAILKEQESGLGTADLCRKHGVSSATFYKWKAKAQVNNEIIFEINVMRVSLGEIRPFLSQETRPKSGPGQNL